RGFKIGAAVAATPVHTNPDYQRLVAREYNLITPENALKFAALHPEPGRYVFCDADSIVAFAQSNGQQVRGHTLVWHNQLPGWIANGTLDREGMMAALQDHISTVVG